MSSDAVTTVSVEIAGSEISFETGRMAKQASARTIAAARSVQQRLRRACA